MLAYLGLATADTLLVACLISVVGGAGNGVQWISVVTTLQEMTPTDYQARIVGLLESLGAAMPGIGYPDRRRPGRARLAAYRVRRGRQSASCCSCSRP